MDGIPTPAEESPRTGAGSRGFAFSSLFADRGPGIILLMVALSLMSYFDRIIMSIAGPAVLREFSLTETELGKVYSAFMLSYALLMIPGGRWVDRFGPRRMLTIMAIGSAVFTALTALAGKPGLGAWLGILPSLLLIRFVLGATAAPIYPACARMNANWKPVEERARTWGWIASGCGVGGALAPLLFSGLIASHGWRIAFWLAGGATLLLGVVWYFYAQDHPPDRLPRAEVAPTGGAAVASWQDLLRNRDLLLLTGSYLTANYFEYIFFYWPYYYFASVRHVSSADTALYTTAIWLSWAVMTPVGGWVSDRLAVRLGRRQGRRPVPMVALTVSAILLFFGARLPNPLTAAVLMCLALGFAAATDGPYWATSTEVGGRQVGAAGGFLNTGGNIGGFLAPWLTPLIAAYSGWEWGLYAGCLIVLGGVVLWLFIGLHPQESAESQPVPAEPAILS